MTMAATVKRSAGNGRMSRSSRRIMSAKAKPTAAAQSTATAPQPPAS